MAKIPLTNGFTPIPEGTHVFKITAIEDKMAFGKLNVTLETQDGLKHVERYKFIKADKSENMGAYNAFSFFARTALKDDDFALDEIDTDDLIGCFIEADVEHDIQPSKNDPNKTVTFVRLADKRPSDGWEEAPAPKAAPTAPKKKSRAELLAMLGG